MHVLWVYAQAYGGVKYESPSYDWHLYTSDLCEDTKDCRISREETEGVSIYMSRRGSNAENSQEDLCEGAPGLPIAFAPIAVHGVLLLCVDATTPMSCMSTSSSSSSVSSASVSTASSIFSSNFTRLFALPIETAGAGRLPLPLPSFGEPDVLGLEKKEETVVWVVFVRLTSI